MLEPTADDHLAWAEGDGARGPKAQSQWLARTLGNVGQQLGQTRDHLFKLANLQRHELVLDLNAGTGLLTWEAVRRAPTGGVWALAADEQTAATLRQQAANLDGLVRPVIMAGPLAELAALITAQEQGDILFDLLIGRNILTRLADKVETIVDLKPHLDSAGRLILVETIPKHTQRLYKLVDLAQLEHRLAQKVIAAEEALYNQADDPMVNWGAADLQQAFAAAGFMNVRLLEDTQTADIRLGAGQIARWFTPAASSQRPIYRQHLQKHLSPDELGQVQALFERQLTDQMVQWETRLVFVVGTISSPL